MIRKLRRKFILISMLAILLVMGVIFSVIYTSTYVSACKLADEKLAYLSENGGSFPEEGSRPKPPETEGEERPSLPDGKAPQQGDENPPDMQNNWSDRPFREGFSPEAPFESRYFSVVFDESGAVKQIDTDHIAAVDETAAESYAKAVLNGKRAKGFSDDYRFLKAESDGETTVIFLDCSRDLDTMRSLLRSTLIYGGVGLLVFFILVWLFSGIVFRPVAEADRKQKRFITDASHELKTPLTVISACCEVLEIEKGEDEWLDSIRRQTEKLTDMTNKLVFLSRADEGRPKSEISSFSLSDIAEETVNSFRPVAEAGGRRMQTEIAPAVFMTGDLSRIRELFSILFDNAMKYSDAEGNLHFSLQKAGKSIRITFSNTTNGVPQGDLSILFDRFYRLDSSRNSETGGNGIGLSIAKAIVEQHGGSISAESPDGKTIFFRIRFREG